MAPTLLAHIGIAVADLEKSIELYSKLSGQEPSSVHEVPEQKVKVAFFEGGLEGDNGGSKIELLSSLSEDSSVANFIRKRGEGLHHICLWVDDLEARMSELKEYGLRLIDEQPRVGAEGFKIAFVHPASCGGVLVELQERAR